MFEAEVVSVTSAERAGSDNSCQFLHEFSSSASHNPTATINTLDGDISYQESFAVDVISPQLILENLSLISNGAKQALLLEFTVTDNIDISSVNLDVLGVSAGLLSSKGGVIDEVDEFAFVKTERMIKRPMPGTDRIAFEIPLDTSLTVDQIDRDSLVFIDAYALDSSANISTISTIRSLGGTLEEKPKALKLDAEEIKFTDPLETIFLMPEVDFEFTGLVDMSGSGTGVTYEVSDTRYIQVANDGRIIPLSENLAAPLFITIRYPGVDDLIVPVTVEFSKELESLEVSDNELVLPSLGQYYSIQNIFAVYDDGSKTRLPATIPLVIAVDSPYESVLDVNPALLSVSSHSVIDNASPASITISLFSKPSVKGSIKVLAKDAPPSVELRLPSSVLAGEEVIITAIASDDVGLKHVDFYINGSKVTSSTSVPYQLLLNITEEMLGQSIEVYAMAYDSIGQAGRSLDYNLSAQSASSITIPPTLLEKPAIGQRVVEGMTVNLALSTNLGKKGEHKNSSGITRVEFFGSGNFLDESVYPRLEERTFKEGGDKITYVYEVWSGSFNAPELGLDETSLAINSKIYVGKHFKEGEGNLIKLIKNESPVVYVEKPIIGAHATEDTRVSVTLKSIDDTLFYGSTVELLLNGKAISSKNIRDNAYIDKGSFALHEHNNDFSFDIISDWVGSELEIQGRIIDAHGVVSVSEVRILPVKADQPPTIALTAPVVGQRVTSGTNLELRAGVLEP